MNCTARMSASANHFLLSEPTMETPVPALWRSSCSLRRGMLHETLAIRKLRLSIRQQTGYTRSRGEELRPVLPDRARPRSRGRALVAARRARAPARGPAPLLRPPRPARRLRHEHPRRAPEGARAGRRRSAATPRSAGGVVGLRAHGVRRGAPGGPPRARALGRSLAPAAVASGETSSRVGSRAPCASRCPRSVAGSDRVPDRRRARLGRRRPRRREARSTLRTPSSPGIRRRSTASWSSATSTPWCSDRGSTCERRCRRALVALARRRERPPIARSAPRLA